MRILLTGAKGFVGARIADRYEVIASPSLRGASNEDIRSLLADTRPEAILHTAAIADMGVCDRDPEGSYHANVLLPLYLAQEAKGAKLVALSTDQVYNASPLPGPYREDEQLSPGNVYARHKLEMEQRVLEANPDAVLLRATWMYDMPLYQGDNRGNFLMNVLKNALAGRPSAFSSKQYRGLTYVRQVADNMVKAIHLPGGIYNFGSENPLHMLDSARALLHELGIEAPLEDAPGRGNLWMDMGKLRQQGITFDTTAEGFARCVRDYNLKV